MYVGLWFLSLHESITPPKVRTSLGVQRPQLESTHETIAMKNSLSHLTKSSAVSEALVSSCGPVLGHHVCFCHCMKA